MFTNGDELDLDDTEDSVGRSSRVINRRNRTKHDHQDYYCASKLQALGTKLLAIDLCDMCPMFFNLTQHLADRDDNDPFHYSREQGQSATERRYKIISRWAAATNTQSYGVSISPLVIEVARRPGIRVIDYT